MNNLNSIYYGIVIDKNDPEQKGRVQVYIPSLDESLINQEKSSISFVMPGNNNTGDLTKSEIEHLRKVCTWATVQQPIFGGSSIGRYDEETGLSSTSDSAIESAGLQFTGTPYSAQSYGSKFNRYGARADAFAQPANHHMRKSNFSGFDYFPENYINAPKGCFSLPEIGTKVTVVFLGGFKNLPVITGKVPFDREITIMQ